MDQSSFAIKSAGLHQWVALDTPRIRRLSIKEQIMYRTYLVSGYKGAAYHSEIITAQTAGEAEHKAYGMGFTSVEKVSEM